jgi:hypothetical protein
VNDRKIRALLDRRARLQAEVRELDEAIERWQRAQLEAMVLSKPESRATVRKMFSPAGRVNVSAAKTNEDAPSFRLLRAAHKKNLTMRSLAGAVGSSAGTISNALVGKKPMRRSIANAIQELIGYRAAAANWPGGILEDSDK